MTAKSAILEYLRVTGIPCAIHEILIPGVSQNAIGTRLPEMAKAGLVVGTIRNGKSYKEWSLWK